MYRTCGAQHGYEPIGSEPRECIAPAVLNMVTMFSTSEPRKVQYRKFMYRTFGTQHGYKFFELETTNLYRVHDT